MMALRLVGTQQAVKLQQLCLSALQVCPALCYGLIFSHELSCLLQGAAFPFCARAALEHQGQFSHLLAELQQQVVAQVHGHLINHTLAGHLRNKGSRGSSAETWGCW